MNTDQVRQNVEALRAALGAQQVSVTYAAPNDDWTLRVQMPGGHVDAYQHQELGMVFAAAREAAPGLRAGQEGGAVDAGGPVGQQAPAWADAGLIVGDEPTPDEAASATSAVVERRTVTPPPSENAT